MKHITKILLCLLCFLICFSSCTFVNELKEEAQKVAVFCEDFVQLVEDPSVERAEELIHPDSPLTPESAVEKIKNNETIKSLNISKEMEISIEEISDVTLLRNDKTLGGNVYGVECQVTVDGTPISISLTMLSTDSGFGVYDFDIK